jgi:hypothetical protein
MDTLLKMVRRSGEAGLMHVETALTRGINRSVDQGEH